MDRRGFMATWIGIALAPLAAAKAITEPRDKLPEPEERDYDNDYRHIAMKGPLLFDPCIGWEYHPCVNGSGHLSDLLQSDSPGMMDIIWGPELEGDGSGQKLPQLPDPPVFPLDIPMNDQPKEFVPYVVPNCGRIPGDK